jgi:uncharacterized membrane protein YgcG
MDDLPTDSHTLIRVPFGQSRTAGAALALIMAVATRAHATDAPVASHVDDQAQMISQNAVARIDSIDNALAARTGKTVVVVTVKSASGSPLLETALREAHTRAPKGTLIYIVKNGDLVIVFDPQTAGLVPPAVPGSIRHSLQAAIKSGDTDGGVTQAVSAIADIIEGGASGGHGPAPQQVAAAQHRFDADGAEASWIWWILGFVVVLVLLRIVFGRRRA